MKVSAITLSSMLALAAGVAAEVLLTDEVPLLGPSFVANFDPSNAPSISLARELIPPLIDKLFTQGPLDPESVILSIDVFSAATNGSIHSYSHVGAGIQEALTSGSLNDRTVSRIGSVSKLFTVYALIAKGGMEILHHPVTRYIPELARNVVDPLAQIRFEDITVGALASHQGGTGGAQGKAHLPSGLYSFVHFPNSFSQI
jgi:CubicO group peptidase (beta-lactamase class C family)